MKKLALWFLSLSLIASAAYAAFPSAQTYRNKFSVSNISINSTAYIQMLSATTRPVGEISVWNSSPVVLQIALGAAGSEQVELTIPPLVGSPTSQQVARYPLIIPQGQRVSVIALDNSTGVSTGAGELEVNFLFN